MEANDKTMQLNFDVSKPFKRSDLAAFFEHAVSLAGNLDITKVCVQIIADKITHSFTTDIV